MSKNPARFAFAAAAVVCALAAVPASAVQPKEPVRDLDQKAFFAPELTISSSQSSLGDVLARLPNRDAWEGFLAGGREGFANPSEIKVWIDPRSGVATNILGAYPLIPGNGFRNRITLQSLRAERVDAAVEDLHHAWMALERALGHDI